MGGRHVADSQTIVTRRAKLQKGQRVPSSEELSYYVKGSTYYDEWTAPAVRRASPYVASATDPTYLMKNECRAR